MHAVILLMVFAANGGDQPVKPHPVLRFYAMSDCRDAQEAFVRHSDGLHAYECLAGVVE